jgi:hypothetical protein
MKLTKSKLKQIIKEELEEVAGVGLSDRSADPEFGNRPEDLEQKIASLENMLSIRRSYERKFREDVAEIADRYGGEVGRDLEAAMRDD